jgi:hypothetical protein
MVVMIMIIYLLSFFKYLTTLLVTHTVQSQMVGRQMNYELEKMRKEAVVTHFKVLFRNSLFG